MNKQWFRMYAEAVDDDKLRLLAFEDRWHFFALLCCKCQGVYDGNSETLVRRLAVKLGLHLAEMDKLKRRLMEADLIDDDWQPLNWDKRQFVSDNSTERVRKFRAKKPPKNSDDTGKKNTKRECNVSETPPEQSRADTEQSRDTTPPRAPPLKTEPPSQAAASPQPQHRKPDRGTRLPDDWTLPDDWRAWTEDQRPEVDIDTEADKFHDYWVAKTGQGATKRDWQATWRNWIRNARGPHHETDRRNRKLSAAERIDEQAERVRAEMRRHDGSAAGSGNGTLAENGGDLRPPLDGEFRRFDDGGFNAPQRNGKNLGGRYPWLDAEPAAPWIPPNG